MDDANLPPSTFVVGDQTRSLTPSPRPTETSKPSIPPAIRKMILELGLRYPPASDADIAAHTARVALLMQDVALVPAKFLEIAIGQWVTSNPWLPKASDLIQMASNAAFSQRQPVQEKGVPPEEAEHRYREQLCTNRNALIGVGDRPDRGFRWWWDRKRKEMQMISFDDWDMLIKRRDPPEGHHLVVHSRAS